MVSASGNLGGPRHPFTFLPLWHIQPTTPLDQPQPNPSQELERKTLTHPRKTDTTVTALGRRTLLLDVKVTEMSAGGLDDADFVAAGVVPMGRRNARQYSVLPCRSPGFGVSRSGEVNLRIPPPLQSADGNSQQKHASNISHRWGEEEDSRRSICGKALGNTTVPGFTGGVGGVGDSVGVGRRKLSLGVVNIRECRFSR